MKKRILLPTDFSKYAWNAINYALELYRNDDCEFFILNTFRENGYVLESMMVPEPGERLYELAKEESDKGLEKIYQQIIATKGLNPNHKIHLVNKFNFLIDAIKSLIEKKDIEMIVMGTKGVTDGTRTIYGSNTVDVMEEIRICPVIAVPAEASVVMPKEIVFPTDYKIYIKKKELNYLIDIVKKTKASLKVLHIINGKENLSDKQLDNKQLLEAYFSEIEYTFHELNHNDIHNAISCFVESRDSNMVAFINKKHSFFGSILSRPLVKDLGYHSKVPVLALHNA